MIIKCRVERLKGMHAAICFGGVGGGGGGGGGGGWQHAAAQQIWPSATPQPDAHQPGSVASVLAQPSTHFQFSTAASQLVVAGVSEDRPGLLFCGGAGGNDGGAAGGGGTTTPSACAQQAFSQQSQPCATPQPLSHHDLSGREDGQPGHVHFDFLPWFCSSADEALYAAQPALASGCAPALASAERGVRPCHRHSPSPSESRERVRRPRRTAMAAGGGLQNAVANGAFLRREGCHLVHRPLPASAERDRALLVGKMLSG